MTGTSDIIKALANDGRLKMAGVLARGELTISELAEVLGQSQPHVTQNLNALEQAGIAERLREGGWVFARLNRDEPSTSKIVDATLAAAESELRGELKKLDAVRAARADKAKAHFDAIAADWDAERARYLPEADVEAEMRDLAGPGPFTRHIDLGTGTGAILRAFSARTKQSDGLDISPDMLAIARHSISGLPNVRVQQGDILNAPFEDASADLITLHQVLHFFDSPEAVIGEAARLLWPGGKLVIADFAPHTHEDLREAQAHRRLGFANSDIEATFKTAGLRLLETRDLPPTSKDGLTVKVWLGHKPIPAKVMDGQGPVANVDREHADDLRVSFEFFPPKTDDMEERLWDAIRQLEPLQPDFVSVTYGAGGTTRERTHRTVKRIAEETSLKPAAHLTCVGAPREEIDQIVRDYREAGVNHIVALRGDPPAGVAARYEPHPGGYAYANDLVAGIRAAGDMEVSVSAYPERHPESDNWQVELDNLKKKVDAGATRAITQFFFEADTFLKFKERARAAGIHIPILPGIMLQPNFKGLKRMASMCGVEVPPWYASLFDGLDKDEETRTLLAASVAAELCASLHEQGVRHFHFYTLNRANLALATCRVLGLKTRAKETSHVG